MTHEPDTALWPAEDFRLLVRISNTGLTARLLPKVQGEGLKIADLQWDNDRQQTLHRIEDAVYEEHLPIDVYDTEILLEPDRMMVAPAEVAEEEDACEDMYELMFKTGQGAQENAPQDDVVCEPHGEVCFIYGLPKGLQGFLQRTFGTATTCCAAAKRYAALLASPGSGTGEQMHVHIRPGRMEVTALRDGKLLLSNSFAYTEPSDAAYYILNAWQTSGMDQQEGQLHLHPEEGAEVSALAEMLKKYLQQCIVH